MMKYSAYHAGRIAELASCTVVRIVLAGMGIVTSWEWAPAELVLYVPGFPAQ